MVKSDLFADVCLLERGVEPDLLESILYLAVELAREGREGRKIGTIFVVGDCDNVLEHSRPMILDPLLGHSDEAKLITKSDVRETVKELAQLDGAFVISGQGVAVSAARHLDVSSEGVEVKLGWGSRHMAGASISKITRAVSVVVSESSLVRVFDDGKLVAEVIPELWMLQEHGLTNGAIRQRQENEVTVQTPAGKPAGN